MIKFSKIFILIIFSFLVSNFVFANEKEIAKINKQLESIKTLFEADAMDEEEYNKDDGRDGEGPEGPHHDSTLLDDFKQVDLGGIFGLFRPWDGACGGQQGRCGEQKAIHEIGEVYLLQGNVQAPELSAEGSFMPQSGHLQVSLGGGG